MSHVPNAIAGRDNIEVEIYGMEGIPEADKLAHELAKSGKFQYVQYTCTYISGVHTCIFTSWLWYIYICMYTCNSEPYLYIYKGLSFFDISARIIAKTLLCMDCLNHSSVVKVSLKCTLVS